MLYLLTPSLELLWNSMPEKTIEIAKQHGGDLGRLEWAIAEEPHSPATVVQLALRHGTECSRGIVFPAWVVSEAERPQKLAQLTAESRQKSAEIEASTGSFMETVVPGWTENGKKMDKELVEAMRKSIAEAQEDADVVLNAPVIPELVSAWEQMGGTRLAK